MNYNRTKKICLFIPNAEGGGAEKIFINLANFLNQEKYEVNLVLSNKNGKYLNLINDSIKVFDLKSKKISFSIIPLILYLRSEKPDYVFSALNHANVICSLSILLSFIKTNHFITIHNILSTNSNYKFIDKFIIKLMRIMSKFSKRLIAVSDSVKDDLVKNFSFRSSNIIVLNNPIDIDGIKVKSNEGFINKKYGKFILGCGRLNIQKDFQLLIKAFSKICSQKKLNLVILGEGEELENLMKLTNELGIAEKVFFEGFVKNPYSYFKNCEVFVLSSKWEGLPTVLIEAMACNCKVISTDCPGGSAYILEDGKWGELTHVGDVDDLSNAMLKTLSNTSSIETNIRAKDFSKQKTMKKYISLIEDRAI